MAKCQRVHRTEFVPADNGIAWRDDNSEFRAGCKDRIYVEILGFLSRVGREGNDSGGNEYPITNKEYPMMK